MAKWAAQVGFWPARFASYTSRLYQAFQVAGFEVCVLVRLGRFSATAAGNPRIALLANHLYIFGAQEDHRTGKVDPQHDSDERSHHAVRAEFPADHQNGQQEAASFPDHGGQKSAPDGFRPADGDFGQEAIQQGEQAAIQDDAETAFDAPRF